MSRRTRVPKYLPALTALAVAVPAGTAAAAPAPGAHWQFDESSGSIAHDSSPNGNHGTITDAARIPGRFGNALSFDGASSKVTVPGSASLEPGTVTVEAWVRAQGTPGNFRYIVSKGATQCDTGSYGLYTGANGGLQFYVAEGGPFTFVRSPDAGPGVWDGQWHHVAGTYDGQTVRTFVDGAEVGTGTPANLTIGYDLISSDEANLGFFNDVCDEAYAYTGDIDEARVWQRALDADEIAASEAMGAAGTRLLAETDFSNDAVVHTARTGPGPDLSVSIASATGNQRIKEVRIAGITPVTSVATCSTGLLALLNPVCKISLSNGGKTATFKLNRYLRPLLAATVTLRVTLNSGKTVTTVSELD